MNPLTPTRRSLTTGATLATLALVLAACGASSPDLFGSPSEEPSAPASVAESVAASVAASVAEPLVRCGVTPDAPSAAAVDVADFSFGGDITLDAGTAATFTNQDGAGHTVTEGTDGESAEDACVNATIGGGQSVVVTFVDPGDYQITCRFHASMNMVVHVQ